jgi:hypothetical protein
LILAAAGGSPAQEVGPAQEQDFLEGKSALESARRAGAEEYAPDPWGRAKELLAAAEEARGRRDPVKFSQASRLARAYAELARSEAELKAEEKKLFLIREELRKAQGELDRLRKASP